MTDTLASKTDILASRSVPFAMATGVLAVDAAAFAMDGLSILSVQRCLARPMRVAHDPAKIQSIVVRNFTPALAALVQRDNIVKTLASGVG